jgi:argininosuccinate lyase
MKLWGGRFTKETDKLVNNFNASISFDQKFYKQDIQGSIAHAKMLGAAGIISEEESNKIQDGLTSILADRAESLKSRMNMKISTHLWKQH